MLGVQISRTELLLIDLTTSKKNVDALTGSRDVVDESALDPKPFAYSGVSTAQHACFDSSFVRFCGLFTVVVLSFSSQACRGLEAAVATECFVALHVCFVALHERYFCGSRCGVRWAGSILLVLFFFPLPL